LYWIEKKLKLKIPKIIDLPEEKQTVGYIYTNVNRPKRSQYLNSENIASLQYLVIIKIFLN